MKKIILGIVMTVFFVSIMGGCTGYRTATLDTSNPDKITHSGHNISLLGPPAAGPTELAQADLITAVAKQIRQGEVNSPFVGVVENNSLQTIWWLHPETPLKMEVKPSGFVVLPLKNMPDEITIFRSDGRYKIFRIENRPKEYAGIQTNFVISINKVN